MHCHWATGLAAADQTAVHARAEPPDQCKESIASIADEPALCRMLLGFLFVPTSSVRQHAHVEPFQLGGCSGVVLVSDGVDVSPRCRRWGDEAVWSPSHRCSARRGLGRRGSPRSSATARPRARRRPGMLHCPLRPPEHTDMATSRYGCVHVHVRTHAASPPVLKSL